MPILVSTLSIKRGFGAALTRPARRWIASNDQVRAPPIRTWLREPFALRAFGFVPGFENAPFF